MCFNECMPFKKFYHQDLNKDHEVSFILELTSILQNEFQQKIALNIKSERSIDHLIDQFKRITKPVVISREVNAEKCWIDLSAEFKIHSIGEQIVSSDSYVAGKQVHKISSYLLNSKIQYPELVTSMT